MSVPAAFAVPLFAIQNPIPKAADALPPPLPPLPANLFPMSLPPVDVLVDWGMSGGRKEASQGEIDEFLKLKIAELEQRAQDQAQLSAVRSDLCKLSCISETYYSARKAEVFDLLRRLLEKDPVTKQTAGGVLKVAIDLNSQFGTAHLLSIPFQQKLARTFSAAVALYLRHYEKKDHVNAVTQLQKEEFLKTIKQFESLNTQKDTSLRFAQKMAHEALKRLVSDRKNIDDMLDRMSLVADALKSAYNKDLAQFCSKMAAAFKGIGDKMPKEWFEAYYAMQKAIWMVNDDLQRIDFIAVMLATKKTDYGWKFIYGSLEDLETIVERKGQRRECIERALVQVEMFIGFNGFVKKALVASDDDRRDDERISKKAQELQKLFKEKLESTDKTAHELSNVLPSPILLPMRQPQPAVLMLPPSQPMPQPSSVNVAFHVTTEQPSVPQPVPLPPLTRTEIFQSVRDGSITKETIERLKKTNGDPINAFRDEDGNTLLMVAAWQGNRTHCELFIAAGAVCITPRASDGCTALHLAVKRDHQGIVLLFTAYPDLIWTEDHQKRSPLVTAAGHDHLGSFNILFKLASDLDRKNAFTTAAFNGCLIIVEACCKNNKYFKPEDFGLALCYGAEKGHVEVCRALITYASTSHKKDEILATRKGQKGPTPILCAAESRAKGSHEIGTLLLNAGADPTIVDYTSKNALHHAIGASRVEFAKLLLSLEKFRSQLLSAYMIETSSVIVAEKFLKSPLKKGLEKRKIPPVDTWDLASEDSILPIFSPIIQSLYCERPFEMFVALFNAGADPRQTDQRGSCGYNTLHHAIKTSVIEAVKLMLKSPYKEELLREPKERRLDTVMTQAVQCARPVEMCGLLLEAGADPTATTIAACGRGFNPPEFKGGNYYGANALSMAFIMLDRVMNKEPTSWTRITSVDFNKLIKCLIDKSPNLLRTRSCMYSSYTPLMCAARCGLTELVDTLLLAGSDPYVTQFSRINVMHIAVHFDHIGVVKRLLELPYRDLNTRTRSGATPLMLARNKTIRELLIAAGALEVEEQQGKEKANCTVM
jgi:ankyrin repeat protein